MQNITNKPTLIWELGTDCLPESDLILLDNPKLVSYVKPEASIINLNNFNDDAAKLFSVTLQEIVKQARSKGYDWLMFDCDVETMVKL